MPKLLEYQGKKLLRDCGTPVPAGEIATTPEEARQIAEKLSRPVVVKSQIETTGRFKAGGIKFADNAADAEKAARELLGKELKGFKVEKVLVEERLVIEQEFYASIIVNDSYKVKGPVLMFSTQGGVDIEEVAAKSPGKVASLNIDILSGLTADDTKKLVSKLGITAPLVEQ